ncbi:MAG: sugar phosphate isomerase/epimerase family protein [Anaerolineae bacterium]
MSDKKMGVIYSLQTLLEHGIKELTELGMSWIQLNNWDPGKATPENAAKVKEILGSQVHISSLWAGWPPPAVWNFIDGPSTLGIVPSCYRYQRMDALKRGMDFAVLLGLSDVTTHMGFIPENPSTTEYREVVAAVRELASYAKRLGLWFNFETGQETPTTLMRIIEDVGTGNLGINLDPANLLLYGKANPVDAVGILGKWIRGVHVKDGQYPTNGRELGHETPVGEGLVNFPVLIPRLLSFGYQGAWIIEREISGPQQTTDIISAKKLLEQILGS